MGIFSPTEVAAQQVAASQHEAALESARDREDAFARVSGNQQSRRIASPADVDGCVFHTRPSVGALVGGAFYAWRDPVTGRAFGPRAGATPPIEFVGYPIFDGSKDWQMPSIMELTGTGDFHLFLFVQFITTGDQTLIEDDDGLLRIFMQSQKLGFWIDNEGGSFDPVFTPGTVNDNDIVLLEVEMRASGQVTLRGGPAGKTVGALGGARRYDLGSGMGPAYFGLGSFDGALLGIASYTRALDVQDARQVRAWMIDSAASVGVDITTLPLAEW